MNQAAPLPPDASTPRGLARAPQGSTWWWLALLVVAAIAYLYGLDGQHVPRIGDEMPYAQVTRLTAASGDWLPLHAEDPFLRNTKPPLLFWLGIVSTEEGRVWTLWRLRFPIVLVTFLVALVTFHLGRRLAGTVAGLIAALVFLGFFATFRYGRPYLTNLPETLFVFLPFAAAIARPHLLDRWGFWAFATLSLGLAAWVKSFALVAPVGFAFAWWMLARRGWRFGEFFRKDAPKLAAFGVAAVGLFLLWPLLDPDGDAIFHSFVGRENLGKITSEGNYLVEMFAGRQSVWRIWFGPFMNVGLYFVVLIALALDAWFRRRALTEAEKALWILVFAFQVVYTFPAHRVENYLLPTAPALAVLIALRWQSFGRLTWRIAATSPLLGGVAAVGFIVLLVRGGVFTWSEWSPLELAVPVAVVALSLWVVIKPRAGPTLFPLTVLLAYLSIACMTSPLEGPRGRFDAARALVRDERVYVPSYFRASQERYRFLLPGSEPETYPEQGPLPHEEWGRPGRLDPCAILRLPLGGSLPADPPRPVHVLGRRLTLLSRPKNDEVRALIFQGRIDAIVQEEVLVEPEARWKSRPDR